jgi:hypothetical protein
MLINGNVVGRVMTGSSLRREHPMMLANSKSVLQSLQSSLSFSLIIYLIPLVLPTGFVQLCLRFIHMISVYRALRQRAFCPQFLNFLNHLVPIINCLSVYEW